MEKYNAYLIDLDGTIYHGSQPIPAAKRLIERLNQAEIPYLFVTNNSTKTAQAVADNLTANHQIPTTTEQVYTSAMATADYVKNLGNGDQKVYLIGELGLQDAFDQAGITCVPAAEANIVVLGLDRDFTYQKLKAATFAIAKGATFIATNADTNLPSEEGMLPGAGSLVAAITTATGIEPTIIAKPEAPIMAGALAKLGHPSRPVMVGDNYNTDILAGIKNGLDTLLVYTGVSKPADVATKKDQPTNFVANFDEWSVE